MALSVSSFEAFSRIPGLFLTYHTLESRKELFLNQILLRRELRREDTKIQKCKKAKMQKYRNKRIEKYRNREKK